MLRAATIGPGLLLVPAPGCTSKGDMQERTARVCLDYAPYRVQHCCQVSKAQVQCLRPRGHWLYPILLYTWCLTWYSWACCGALCSSSGLHDGRQSHLEDIQERPQQRLAAHQLAQRPLELHQLLRRGRAAAAAAAAGLLALPGCSCVCLLQTLLQLCCSCPHKTPAGVMKETAQPSMSGAYCCTGGGWPGVRQLLQNRLVHLVREDHFPELPHNSGLGPL